MRIQSAATIAGWASGRVSGEASAQVGPDVVIDSRRATAGSLFVALVGERVDGHDFASEAVEAGASAVLSTRLTDAPVPHILVDDAVAALSGVARGVVSDAVANGLVVCAITGSSGKTSTKDLLAQLLAASGPTVAPIGSLNNEIGLPLTACKVDAGTRYLVSEMGSRGKGHIRWLCSITLPRVAAVINVGTAHLGEFGSRDAIAEAKGEIVEALDADGWAVLNADDSRVAAMRARTRAHVAWFTVDGSPEQGVVPESAELVVRASDISCDELQRYTFTLHWTLNGAAGADKGSARVSLPLMGRHLVVDAVAAAACAIAAGVAPQLVARRLSTVEPRSRWRMELRERSDGAVVINDSYNANPDSMAAALTALGEVIAARRRVSPNARAIAVLGDMLELGPGGERFHREVGEQAARVGVDRVIAVGALGRYIAEGARAGGVKVIEVADAMEASRCLDVRPDDVVLVKASRGMALESVADAALNGVTR